MRFTWGLSMVNDLVFWIALSSLASIAVASDQCAPSTWQPGQFKQDVTVTSLSSTSSTGPSTVVSSSAVNASTPLPAVTISPLVTCGNISVGQVNCRYAANTEGTDINYYTCTKLAQKYGVDVATFFKLNPTVLPDCSNIKPNTDYCVAGFIEPLRSNDGLCGPSHGNATCLGAPYQCCNSNTWTCGNSTADCADGTRYEGACAGDSVFSTTGQCGTQNGNKRCAGLWGDCCNAAGRCGMGAAFCGTAGRKTTDGTCGLSNYNTCNIIWGNCCNSNGTCGSDPSDYRQGCQPLYGNCTTPSPTFLPANSPTTIHSPTTTAFSALPSCSQTCFSNMQAQYSTLGCSSPDSSCLCNNPNFGYGLCDCANGACGTAVASNVIAYGSAYCSTALATHTANATGFAALPSCGQTCFKNMKAQYSSLGCSSSGPPFLCKNSNFGYGPRDCANGA